MSRQGMRWIQRAKHFDKAFSLLEEAVELARQRQLSKLEAQGVIQGFEYTHELAWNTLKDFLETRGVQALYGSRDTTRAAFRTGLIEKGETWMEMIQSRNLTSHTYNEATADQVVGAILDSYFAAFQALRTTLAGLKQEDSP